MNIPHLADEVHSSKLNDVCEEALVLVKIQTGFFINFKPDYKNRI